MLKFPVSCKFLPLRYQFFLILLNMCYSPARHGSSAMAVETIATKVLNLLIFNNVSKHEAIHAVLEKDGNK